MRRFVCLLVVVLFAMPLGLSMAGCGHGVTTRYCNGNGYGPTAGQIKTITLAQSLTATGESLSYGQIGSTLNATAEDCFNTAVAAGTYTFATTDLSIADVNPANGSVCAGSWNRNTGGGIADFTVCTPPAATNKNHNAFITASAGGAVSNPIAIYVHAPVTGVVLGNNATASCSTDPATSCCPVDTNGATVTALPYNPTQCLSQNQSRQLVARVYANGTTNPADNITCQVGVVNFALQGATNVATIGPTGVATANQPGSALVTATVANSSSALNSGFISTCPPASIVLTAVGTTATATGSSTSSITVALNTPQAFNATVLDTNGLPLSGLALEFNSTLPVNFPTGSGTVTADFPGSATVTAVCQPGSCNPAPFSQIGYLGNGKPITSNGITVTAPGTVSTVLYMGSTSSQYVASEDFTTGQLGAPLKLPYVPNSMVISQDGSTIYLGSNGGLMTITTASNALTGVYQTVQGSVLAVAPNNTSAVVTDPTRSTVSLVNSTGGVVSSFNGVGTHAQWTPDSTTLYVTTASNQLLTYSTFVGWESTTITDEPANQQGNPPLYNDVAVTVPSVGAYFAGFNTDGRSYCAATTLASDGPPPTASNVFSPLADIQAVTTDRIAATTDGKHILGATVSATPAKLVDIGINFLAPTGVPPSQTPSPLVCTNYGTQLGPTPFNSSYRTQSLAGITATSITGVVPSSNSNVAVVTYTGSGGVVPLYAPGTGTITNVPLTGGATTAPVAGTFSTDNTTFYAGTSGDNVVHSISINGTKGTDSGVITPNLPDVNGNIATPNLIVQRARRSTS